MTEAMERRLGLFVEDAAIVKRGFKWQRLQMRQVAALLYTAEGKTVDTAAIRRSYELIKANTGLFSMFRGNTILALATLLSLNEAGEIRMSDTLRVYDLLKEARFWGSDYLVVAAWQIASNTDYGKYEAVVGKMRAYYDGMKGLHPLLTGSDDTIYAAMLGLSDVDAVAGVERMERLYRELKPEFHSGNGVQALSEVLVLGDQTAESIGRVRALRQSLRYKGLKMENPQTLPSLGILALLPGTAEEIVHDVAEAFWFLRAQKGFGAWSVTKQEVLLYAAALAAYERLGDVKNGLLTTALCTSITNIILAQQAAMITAISASSAAAAAAAT
jgi:hypothetical protein